MLTQESFQKYAKCTMWDIIIESKNKTDDVNHENTFTEIIEPLRASAISWMDLLGSASNGT